jgi:hypothetical protein
VTDHDQLLERLGIAVVEVGGVAIGMRMTGRHEATARTLDAVAKTIIDAEVALRAALATRPQPDEDRIATALWRCVVASGMDTDGDPLEWYLRAKGLAGLAEIAAKAVEELRRDYDECLDELPAVAGSATSQTQTKRN